MSRIRVTRQLKEVLLDALAHKFVLLIVCEEFDQSLYCMSTLFVSNNVCNVFMKSLHYFESLSIVTDTKKFLYHVISVLMGDELRKLHVKSLND